MCTSSCLEFTSRALSPGEVAGSSVLEVGALDVNGSPRPIIEAMGPSSYIGVDLQGGPGVDELCDACALVERFGPTSFDLVVSTEMLEHARHWQGAMTSMKSVLRPGGHLVLTTRSKGFPYHGYPEDFWRFEEEDMRRIFMDFEHVLVEADPEAPGVFVRATKPAGDGQADLSDLAVFSILTDRPEPSLRAVMATLAARQIGIGHEGEARPA